MSGDQGFSSRGFAADLLSLGRTFAGFGDYVVELEELAFHRRTLKSIGLVGPHLDGRPSAELRARVVLAKRRERGTFFSTAGVRAAVGPHLAPESMRRHGFFDAACGAGDLLLTAAETLPLRRTVPETLASWGTCLAGRDIVPEFVAATVARLTLLAKVRTGRDSTISAKEAARLLRRISIGDGIAAIPSAGGAFLLLNPPYAASSAPNGYSYGEGRVSAAAVWVDECLKNMQGGQRLLAVLPDVLRSGVRYGRWRAAVEERSSAASIEILDQFDPWTDVHVFLMSIVRGNEGIAVNWSGHDPGRRKTINDLFAVSVGSVVPHRHPERGKSFPYLHARALRAALETGEFGGRRRFTGTTSKPPFVVVRRTSRPGDVPRASAAVILGDEPVAVENHLLILAPRDGSVASCDSLVERLESPEATAWLDREIRCRHITAAALRALPWNDAA